MAQDQERSSKDERIPLKSEDRASTGLIPTRWITALLGSCGFMVVYGLKVNMSVAIIAMVNHTAIAGHYDISHDNHDISNTSDPCTEQTDGAQSKGEAMEDGPFYWDENIQGLILAAYFYGYIVTQVPGGWVAERFSAKHVFGVGALLNAILALLTPICAKGSYIWLVAARIGMGIAGGVTLPAMHVLVANWAPPQERSRIASTVYAGMTLGTLICMPLSGILASELGWESIFYVQGALSLIWYVLWLLFVFDSPSRHPRISFTEKKYIEDSIGQLSGGKASEHEKMSVPWKEVWTSWPVWAIIVAHTCGNWGWYMLLVKLPTYMRYILHFDIKSNAALSCVPFLCMWVFTMLLASLLDYFKTRGTISTTFARKFATFVASMLPGVCLILVTYVGCNTALAVVFLTLGTMFVGGMYSGYLANHIDIAPPFAGTLMGITNTFATIPGIVVPSFIGYMTHGNQTVETWRIIFFITFAILSFEAIFFAIFGSGEQQPWAKRKSTIPEGEQMHMKEGETNSNP